MHQLDHYLPAAHHSVYTVTPVNLVPACADCNKVKSAYVAASAADQTLHPYFDNVQSQRWLVATVVATVPAALAFSVVCPGDWDDILKGRVATHFRVFRLGALYATHSAVELSNIRYGLQKMSMGKNNMEKIRSHLQDRAESCAAVHQNSWQRATYSALAESDWYCSGGFALV